jgi:germacradienol/geosmin synthase
VLVIQNFLACGSRQAVSIANDLMTSRLHRFERIVATELPALFDDRQLDAGARRILTGYVRDLQDWMAGVLKWHQVTRRYRESDLRRAGVRPAGVTVAWDTCRRRLGPSRRLPA